MEEFAEILENFSRSFEEVSNQLKRASNLIRAEDKETASIRESRSVKWWL